MADSVTVIRRFLSETPLARRYDEILSAFDAQAPFRAGEERFDVTTIALEVLAGMKS